MESYADVIANQPVVIDNVRNKSYTFHFWTKPQAFLFSYRANVNNDSFFNHSSFLCTQNCHCPYYFSLFLRCSVSPIKNLGWDLFKSWGIGLGRDLYTVCKYIGPWPWSLMLFSPFVWFFVPFSWGNRVKHALCIKII